MRRLPVSEETLKKLVPHVWEREFLNRIKEFQRQYVLRPKYSGPPGGTLNFGKIGALANIVGSETRLRILLSLSLRDVNVVALAKQVGVSPSTLMEHLRILEAEGAVRGRVEGRMRIYSLADSEEVRELSRVIKTWSAQG